MSSVPATPASSAAVAGEVVPISTGNPAAAPSRMRAVRAGPSSRSARGTQTSASPSTPIRRRSWASARRAAQDAAASSAEPAGSSSASRSLTARLSTMPGGAPASRGAPPACPPCPHNWLAPTAGLSPARSPGRPGRGPAGSAAGRPPEGGSAPSAVSSGAPVAWQAAARAAREAGRMPVVEHDDRLAAAQRGVHQLEAGERHVLLVGPATSTPRFSSAQRSSATAPVAGTTPRAHAVPGEHGAGPDGAGGEGGAQRRDQARAAAAEAPTRRCAASQASRRGRPRPRRAAARRGNCRGSQPPIPAKRPRRGCPAGEAAARPDAPGRADGPAAKPASASRGPAASIQARPAAAGASSHHGRHAVTRLTTVNATARTRASCASSEMGEQDSDGDAPRSARGAAAGIPRISCRARRGSGPATAPSQLS